MAPRGPRGLRRRGRGLAPAAVPTPGATFDAEVEIDACGDLADGHLGHQPRAWSSRSPTGSRTRPRWSSLADRETAERALAYMGLEPGTPMTELAPDRVFIGSCTNSRIEDLRRRRRSSRVEGSPRCGRWSSPAPQVKRPPKPRGCNDFPRRRLRVARGGLLDVPGDEPRHRSPRASAAPRPRTVTSRGARARLGEPTWSARRWRPPPPSRAISWTSGIGAEDGADR